MNSKEIAAVLLKDIHSRRVFKGVYPRNRLPFHVYTGRPCAFVINTDVASGPGKHWVAVWFNGKGGAEYFDSFGLPPSSSDIKQFIVTNSFTYFYNHRLLQDLTSSMCGYYVLYFVMKKSRGASMSRLLAPFHPHKLQTNDQRVGSLVHRLQRK